MTRLRNYFIAGVLVTAPTVVSFYFLFKAFLWVDNLLGGLFQGLTIAGHTVPALPGFGVAAVVIIILIVGFITSGYLGSRILHIWETVVSTIPLINRLYPALKQIGSAFLAEQHRAFRDAVLIEYPRKGVYSLAFSTKKPPSVVQKHVDQELISVFLPTTPNPTSGFLLMVPKAETTPLQMTVEEALKLVISGGMVTPGAIEPPVAQAAALEAGNGSEAASTVEAAAAEVAGGGNRARGRGRRGRRGGAGRERSSSTPPRGSRGQRGGESSRRRGGSGDSGGSSRRDQGEPPPERDDAPRPRRRRW